MHLPCDAGTLGPFLPSIRDSGVFCFFHPALEFTLSEAEGCWAKLVPLLRCFEYYEVPRSFQVTAAPCSNRVAVSCAISFALSIVGQTPAPVMLW